MACTYLYREVHGAGDDSESENPNGIIVTLSYWETHKLAPNHFLLTARVMIDRQIFVDQMEAYSYPLSNATNIRKAIAIFDSLKAEYPQVKENKR